MPNKLIGTAVAVVAVVAVGYVMYAGQGNVLGAQTDAREVRWLLSHQPTDVFARAAEVFRSVLEQETDGALTLRIITPEEIGVPKGDVPNADVMRFLSEGEADLATAYTVGLGFKSPDLWALNLPFLFANHAAVAEALEGDFGEVLADNLRDTQGVVGLAFTMSGGFRIIASKNTKIESSADFAGKRIVTSGGPVAEETLRALGAIPVRTDLESGTANIDAQSVDGVEITYSRLKEVIGKTEYTTYLNETNHSVFLTMILAGNTFFDSLSSAEKEAVKKAARAAAAVEREDSRVLGENVRTSLVVEGSVVTRPSAAAQAEFIAKTKSVYGAFADSFSAPVAAALDALR